MFRHVFRLIFLPICIVAICANLTLLALGSQASLSTAFSISSETDFDNTPLTGTASTIAVHTRQGEGAVYQAIGIPSRTDAQNHTATWIGNLNAFFIDAIGNLREDGNGDGILQENDYVTDPAISIFFDQNDQTSKLARFKFKVTPATSAVATSEIKSLDDLHPLWSAHKRLSALSDVIMQRSYSTRADTGRHIFTYLDLNGDGVVDRTEVKDFVPASFGAGSYGVLNVADAVSARTLVNYIRGDESQNAIKGMRNRTLDSDADGIVEVMRLGDIVNSTPTEVGAPAESFDLLYRDKSYGIFRAKYSHRRNVVYVGANGGMIHAFNAGFYNAQKKSYDLQGKASEVKHPLGSELWAYIPYNLLPHLTWLQSRNYRHVWYVDGKPRIFDAKIFPADATHPGGWGTVMAIGMRFGGAPIQLNIGTHAEGFSAFTSNGAAITSLTTRSAYVLMDVTDPEQRPTLLAEITDPTGSLGFTSCYPTIAAFNSSGDTAPAEDDHWYLIFGSGPDSTILGATYAATSTRSAKLYVYDLIKKTLIGNAANSYRFDLALEAPNSFVGDPVTADWDLNYKVDALYFGTVGGSENKPVGKLFKLDFNPTTIAGAETSDPSQWAMPAVLADPGNPMVSAPSITKDEQGNRWIIAGTGRLFTQADQSSKQAQSLFGLIDILPSAAPNYSQLLDVSNAKVSSTGTVENVSGAKTQDELMRLVQSRKGWKRSLAHSVTGAAERNINPISLLGGIIFATANTPCIGPCLKESSALYCLYYKTGTANSRLPACGIADDVSRSGDNRIVAERIDLGEGISASPSLHLNQDEHSSESTLTVMTQSTTGAITQTITKAATAVRSGEIDWREINR